MKQGFNKFRQQDVEINGLTALDKCGTKGLDIFSMM